VPVCGFSLLLCADLIYLYVYLYFSFSLILSQVWCTCGSRTVAYCFNRSSWGWCWSSFCNTVNV